MKNTDRSSSRLSIPTSPISYRPSSPTPSRAPTVSFSPTNTPLLSPFVSRTPSHLSAQRPVHSQPPSGPATPFETPSLPASDGAQSNTVHRLLMPTVRSARPAVSPRLPQNKSSPSKIPKSRGGSVSTLAAFADQSDRASAIGNTDWIGDGCKFELVEEQLELEGYQIFAVEKWVVERRRPVIVLTVFTGDPKDKIIVTALSPQSTLSPPEAQAEWDKAIRHLRREGARPKDTGKGILMVTSLANFRSDYTIVRIPQGNFLDVREQLYTNINLLRMGCGGRSALTLEEPSDTTKDRFILMYHIPEKIYARSGTLFNATVLELVKLIQAALAIFDVFDVSSEERNGLLCDVTCEGIRRWVTEIGEPVLEVEHMERVMDPTVVSALFSLILSIRNKLHALGHYVPKDPFLDPQGFTRALATCQTSKLQAHAHNLVHPHSPSASSPPRASNTSPKIPSTAPSAANSPAPPAIYLTLQLVESIQSAYIKKSRQSESYKVHRVLINKLDDLASDLRTSANAVVSPDGGGGMSVSALNPTTDLNALVHVIVGSPREAPHSLRYLWTGRPDEVGRKRKEKEAVYSDVEKDERERECEKDGGRERSREREKDMRSSGEESEPTKPWPGRVQRKIESWAALGRTKKLSVDFGVLGKALLESPNRGGHPEQWGTSPAIPSVRVTGDPDDEDPLSSGQPSPTLGTTTPLMAGMGSVKFAQRSASELSEYDRRVTEFNRKRPATKAYYQSRITSWADPFSAQDEVDEDHRGRLRVPFSSLRYAESLGEEDETSGLVSDTEVEGTDRRRRPPCGPRRCRSFDAATELKDMRVQPIERMRIDVELCGQLLIMHRRDEHLANVASCLAALAEQLSRTNSRLRTDHESARGALEGLRERETVLHDLEAARTRADALTQETQALAYESAQFLVDDLWHMAAQPRRRVLALREKAFGTGRRQRAAHGRFNRVQWTLDGRERLVDALGRTESEAEAEDGLPGEESLEHEEQEEEADVVEHQSLRPTWLLKFFNYWGRKWGPSRNGDKAADSQTTHPKESESERELSRELGRTTSVPPSTTPPHLRTRYHAQHTATL